MLKWPSETPFSEAINLYDFWIENLGKIRQAYRSAIKERKYDEKLAASLEVLKRFNHSEELTLEKVPTTTTYGISAETYWINFSGDSIFPFTGRCRVDYYQASQLLILTDIREGAVQIHLEKVLKTVVDQLKLNPLEIGFIQRYEWIPELIHRVSITYRKKTDTFTDPDWKSITPQQFHQRIHKAERFARQLIWATVLVPVNIQGQYQGERLLVTMNTKPIVPLVNMTGQDYSNWGVGITESRALATALCWKLLKHMPSVMLIRSHFEKEFVQPLTEKQYFSIQINMLDLLKRHQSILKQSQWPEWAKLK